MLLKIFFLVIPFQFYCQSIEIKDIKLKKRDSLIFSTLCLYNLNSNQDLIKISKEDFNCIVANEQLFKNKKTFSKRDSLGVYLYYKFDDWKLANNAYHRINYSWNRLSKYLYINEKDLILIGKKIGINHPYILKLFFIDDSHHDLKLYYTNKLKDSLIQKGLDKIALKNSSNEQLLKLAFKNHKEVKKFWDNHGKKHHH